GPWIGGVEVGSSGEFVWSSTNASILSTNWADNEPDSPTSGDAIVLDCENEFKWRDLETTTSLPFMCESDANPPPVIWGCPEGFQMAGEGCYHFGDQLLDFDDSLTYCRGLGGKLVEFETADEMFTFNEYFTENVPSPCGGVAHPCRVKFDHPLTTLSFKRSGSTTSTVRFKRAMALLDSLRFTRNGIAEMVRFTHSGSATNYSASHLNTISKIPSFRDIFSPPPPPSPDGLNHCRVCNDWRMILTISWSSMFFKELENRMVQA
ncbi:unnamed protein product, partial [Cyprideis torosa]